MTGGNRHLTVRSDGLARALHVLLMVGGRPKPDSGALSRAPSGACDGYPFLEARDGGPQGLDPRRAEGRELHARCLPLFSSLVGPHWDKRQRSRSAARPSHCPEHGG